jgi:hypothetical protein
MMPHAMMPHIDKVDNKDLRHVRKIKYMKANQVLNTIKSMWVQTDDQYDCIPAAYAVCRYVLDTPTPRWWREACIERGVEVDRS